MLPLYDQPLRATRTGPLFNAFSYPTKIDPEVIAVFVAAHTDPGQTVLDVFGGSGTTGIAVALCDKPTERMRALVADAGINATWGPRNAHIYELSPLGTRIGEFLANPPDPHRFQQRARHLLEQAEQQIGEWYSATSPTGKAGSIRHVIWSETLRTSCCHVAITLYDAILRLDPVRFMDDFECPNCLRIIDISDCKRDLEQVVDPYTHEAITQRCRIPVRIFGTSKSTGNWSRHILPSDLEVIDKIPSPPNHWVPQDEMRWGDLHRSGYHTGIERIYHLYTRRNLATMSKLWALASTESDHDMRQALQLWILSYNSSHSTILTRVVAKRSQKDLIVTGAQSGVLYVSGLPVEKNILRGLRRKLGTLTRAIELTSGSGSRIECVNSSSTSLSLEDGSVDYVFTDPPFGNYIPYSEINQLNEAWLDQRTDQRHEVIISPAQDKTVEEYAGLMKEVFAEISRVMKPTGCATVVFHASTPAVWEAIGSSFRANGMVIGATSILNKEQVTFKQVVSEGGTRDDALFLLLPCGDSNGSAAARSAASRNDIDDSIRTLLALAADRPEELTSRRMWSRYVAMCLANGDAVGVAAPEFYSALHRMRLSGDATPSTV